MAKIFSTKSNTVDNYELYGELLPKYQQKKAEKIIKEKKKPSFLQKAFSWLTTGETGSAAYAMLEGKNPLIEYANGIKKSVSGSGLDNKTYRDVLEKMGMKKTYLSEKMPDLYSETGKGLALKKSGFFDPTSTGAAGLGLDILLDPKTYLGGAGLFTKIGRGLKGLTKVGTEVVEGVNKSVLRNITKKGLKGTNEEIKLLNEAGERIMSLLAKNPDKNFKGITFMGKEIIPRKVALAPGRFIDKTMQHIPVVNSVYTGAKNGIQDVFKYGADMLRKGKDIGEMGEETALRYIKAKQGIYKYVNRENENLFKELTALRKELKTAIKTDEAGLYDNVIRSIEEKMDIVGLKGVDEDLVKRFITKIDDLEKGVYGKEANAYAKLQADMYNELSGYLPHKLTTAGRKLLEKKNPALMRYPTYKAFSTAAEKERTLLHFVDDAGNELKGAASANKLQQVNVDKMNLEQISNSLSIKGKFTSREEAIKVFKDTTGSKKLNNIYLDGEGKIWRADRPLSINESNEVMKPLMEKAGMNGKFFETDPFVYTIERGREANKKIANLNFLDDVVKINSRTTAPTMVDGKRVFAPIFDEKTGITYVDPKIAQLPDGTLLPDFIVKDMKKQVKFLNEEELPNKILKVYDKFLNVWKGSVYGWYPASHGRNLIGGTFNNYLANPKFVKFMNKIKPVLQGKEGSMVLNGNEYTYKQIKKQIVDAQILGQTGYLDVNDIAKTFDPNFLQKTADFPMKAMESVESSLRVPLFLAEIDDGKTFKQAADTVFKYHFDYAPEALTAIERNIMRRFIPFYKWNRENIPLMVEEMISQPGKMSGFYKMIRTLQDEDGKDLLEYLPSYLQNELTITRGGQTVQGLGMPPIEMLKFLSNPFKQGTSMLSPFIKTPIELSTNYSFFKDKQISEDKSGEFARNYPKAVRDWLEWEESNFEKDGKTIEFSRVNPLKKYWLYALPTARLAAIIKTVGGEEEKNKVLYGLSGIRTLEFDKEEMKQSSESMFEKQIMDILKDAYLVSEYGTPFKSTKEKLKNQ